MDELAFIQLEMLESSVYGLSSRVSSHQSKIIEMVALDHKFKGKCGYWTLVLALCDSDYVYVKHFNINKETKM